MKEYGTEPDMDRRQVVGGLLGFAASLLGERLLPRIQLPPSAPAVMLSTGQLEVHPLLQRQLSKVKVGCIAERWEQPLLMAPLAIAQMPDGRRYVVDGQHRLAASRARGWERVPCEVVEVTSMEEVTDLYMGLRRWRSPRT